MTYNPNYWLILRMSSDQGVVFYKVFATWVGGYVNGDSWRMNSGIVQVKRKENIIEFHGTSGSIYECLMDEGSYRTSMYTQSVLDSMIQKADLIGAKIEVLPFETNFEELIDENCNQ